MTQVTDSILEKVQKLQALAERAGSPEEAVNAMARISEILLKYNLDMATVANHKIVEKDDIIYERHNLNDYQTYHDGDYALNLIRGIAKFNFCRLIRNITSRREYKKDQNDFTIIGQRHNVQVVMYMYDYCINNLKILANEGWKVYDKRDTKIKTVFTRHFFDGAVNAITMRLYVQNEESKATYKGMYDMVLYNDKAVDLKVKELFSYLTSSTRKVQRESGAKSMGYAAGEKLNLANGIGGNGDNKRIS